MGKIAFNNHSNIILFDIEFQKKKCKLLPSLQLLDFFIPISKTAKIAAFMLITLALELFSK